MKRNFQSEHQNPYSRFWVSKYFDFSFTPCFWSLGIGLGYAYEKYVFSIDIGPFCLIFLKEDIYE